MTGVRGPTVLPPGLLISSALQIKRRVFFSFHYARDAWSVGQIRNSWLARSNTQAQPFFDKAQWESIRRRGDQAVKSWIDRQLQGTSVTVVLIGPETLQRRWVKYEIDQSLKLKKGLLGITMEGMKQSNGSADNWREYAAYGPFLMPRNTAPIYSWIAGNGRQNIASWIAKAAADARR